MNRKVIIIFIALVFAAIAGGYKYLTSANSSASGLRIVSTPITSIYLDDKLLGKTPLDTQHKSGQYVLKLIPEDPSSGASAWQGNIVLNPSVLTYVNKDLGSSELKTSGEILILEKISQNDAEVNVTSQPDGSTILLDGQEKGKSPILLKDVVSGEHDVAVSATGFIQRTVRIQATAGYKLNVDFQLALSGDETASSSTSSAGVSPSGPTPDSGDLGTEKTPAKPYALIKDTPTGFLRVRIGPNLSASETAQVKPGEKYAITGDQDGWFKITLDNGRDGWISNRYAQKVE